jgi:hypothetical protein
MNTRTCIVLFTIVAFAVAQSIPNWPPAGEYIANITYTPGFYEGSEDMSGAFYYSQKLNRYVVDSKDPLRTYETAVFLQDKNTQYVVSKFGEFAPDCIEYDNSGLTGAVSFVPPFGFNSTTISSAKFTGTKACANKTNEDCDFFDYDAGKGRTVTFAFINSKMLYSIEDKMANGVSRKASFANYVLKHADDAIFQAPSGVQCHAPEH